MLATTANTLRQPKRAAAMPESGMVSKEPMPMHRSSMPSTPSSICSLALSKGTSGAQEAAPKPPTKNKARVACCCQSPGFS